MNGNIDFAKSIIGDVFSAVQHGECFYSHKEAEYVKRLTGYFIEYLEAAVKEAEEEK